MLLRSVAPAPSAFPPTPRTARLRSESISGAASYVILGTIVVGLWIWALGPLILTTATRNAGTTADGKVTGKRDKQGRKSGHSWVVEFSFQLNGDEHQIERAVDVTLFDKVHVGDPIKVLALPVWAGPSALVKEPRLPDPEVQLCPSAFAIIMSVAGVFIYLSNKQRARAHRTLACVGVPTIGRITNKKESSGKRATYWLTFCFETGDTHPHEATMLVKREQFEEVKIGQSATVLYDPEQPHNGIIYCFGDYQVVGM